MSLPDVCQQVDIEAGVEAGVAVVQVPVHQLFECDVCSSASAWLDCYGGGPHCSRCKPPPSQSLVSQTIGARELNGFKDGKEFVIDEDDRLWWITESESIVRFTLDPKSRRKS